VHGHHPTTSAAQTAPSPTPEYPTGPFVLSLNHSFSRAGRDYRVLFKLAEFLVAAGMVDDISCEGLRILLRGEGIVTGAVAAGERA